MGVPLGVRRGAWTEEEDALLRKCIEKHGEGKWHQVPFRAGLNRCRKSCRLRWMNYLRPNIKRGSFTVDEVDLIIRLHKLLGNRWSLIAGRLPGRTANGVKNYWNSHLQKKLESESVAKSNKPMAMGITKVIRPQPRTFSKSSLPWLRTKTVILNPGEHHHIQTSDNRQIKITKPCTLTTGHHIRTMDNLITEPSHPQSSAGAGDHDGSTFWWNDIILDDDMEIAWSVGGSSAAEEGNNNIVAGQNWDGKLTPGMEKPGHNSISVELEGRQSDYWSDVFVSNEDLWDILFDDQAVILQ